MVNFFITTGLLLLTIGYLMSGVLPISPFFYGAVFAMVCFPLVRPPIPSGYRYLFLGGMLAAFFIYVLWLPLINAIELWGDEIGVIQFARLPFEKIPSYVAAYHAAVPPLDYWNLWFWNKLAPLFPIPFHEFFYRIPYMVIHTIGATLFGFILLKELAINRHRVGRRLRALVYFVGFFAFFFHPLLFWYSLDVRFYSLAATGSVVILYFFLYPDRLQKRHVPFLLFLCLNALSQNFLTGVLFLKTYIHNRQLYLLAAFGALGILLFVIGKHMLIPQPIPAIEMRDRIVTALKDFWSIPFPWIVQSALAIICIAGAFVSKNRRMLTTLIFGIGYFLVVSVGAFAKGYFDFHVRHYAFIVPWVLYSMLGAIVAMERKVRFALLGITLIIFIIPWGMGDYISLSEGKLISKALIGSKVVSSVAKQHRARIFIAPNEGGGVLPSSVFEFYTRSIVWYGQQYGVSVSHVPPGADGCLKIASFSSVVVVSLTGDSPCFPQVEERSVFSTRYKVHDMYASYDK